MRLIFRNRERWRGGNAKELGDVGMRPGKSFLFFLTGFKHPEIRLAGEGVVCPAESLHP